MNQLIFFTLFFLSLNIKADCPDLTKNESHEDCPWASITRQIADEEKSCEQVFKQKAPDLISSLELDKKSDVFIKLWGTAKNFDENAKAIIVDKKIINCLAEKLKLSNPIESQTGFDIVHSGLQHTYSYLFSNTMTPYGYKRARWTKDDLFKGLGLTKNVFLPSKTNGAFLANVTYLFAKLAFKEDLNFIRKIEKIGLKNKMLSKEIINVKPDLFEIKNLAEKITDHEIILHTTFVKFTSDLSNSKNNHLLIYWVENTKLSTKVFITGFPVDQTFVNKALDEKNLGANKVITARYNAWVRGITDKSETQFGSRSVSH